MPFPTICLNDKQHRPNEWPTFRFKQSTPGTQEVTLHTSDGAPLALTDGQHKVFLRAVTHAGSIQEIFCIEGTIVDEDEGIISFEVTSCHTTERGLFLASVYVTDTLVAPNVCDGSDPEDPPHEVGNKIASYRAYVEIEQDWANGSSRVIGVTIAEVRMAMRDLSGEDNFLLDDVEFTDSEIAWAMRRPVDQWNETPPALSGASNYTPSNFPYRYQWLNAVKGELMLMAAISYRRNHLDYKAAGLSVDDKRKFTTYEQIGRGLLEDWRIWILTQKKSLNFQRSFSRVELRSYGNYPYNSGNYTT
jgi:hypothetical protein